MSTKAGIIVRDRLYQVTILLIYILRIEYTKNNNAVVKLNHLIRIFHPPHSRLDLMQCPDVTHLQMPTCFGEIFQKSEVQPLVSPSCPDSLAVLISPVYSHNQVTNLNNIKTIEIESELLKYQILGNKILSQGPFKIWHRCDNKCEKYNTCQVIFQDPFQKLSFQATFQDHFPPRQCWGKVTI